MSSDTVSSYDDKLVMMANQIGRFYAPQNFLARRPLVRRVELVPRPSAVCFRNVFHAR